MTIKTDAQILNSIKANFSAMMDTVECIIDPFNPIRAMIVTGAPGVGKSYNLIKRLEEADANLECNYHKISGEITPLGLYQALHKTSEFGSVLLLDDADVFGSEGTLDLLKAALDSSKTRTVSYISTSPILAKQGIPNQIDYKGKIIFITNKDFSKILQGTSKLQPHVKALVTRATFIDLQIHDIRSVMIQIEDVMTKTNIVKEHGLTQDQAFDILNFMKSNTERLVEPSLRMPVNLSGLVKKYPQNWQDIAKVTCLRAD